MFSTAALTARSHAISIERTVDLRCVAAVAIARRWICRIRPDMPMSDLEAPGKRRTGFRLGFGSCAAGNCALLYESTHQPSRLMTAVARGL